MENLTDELKQIAKLRGIKEYKSMSKERLISSINESKTVKENNFNGARTEKIRKDFNELRDRLSNPKIKEIRKDLYKIENKKKRDWKNPLRSENSLSKLKKYYDYDDIEYRGIRDVKNLFDLSIDEDYYKPIRTIDNFNSNYIEYEMKGDKNKTLSIKEYLTYFPTLKLTE